MLWEQCSAALNQRQTVTIGQRRETSRIEFAFVRSKNPRTGRWRTLRRRMTDEDAARKAEINRLELEKVQRSAEGSVSDDDDVLVSLA